MATQPTLYLMLGYPGAGKSTTAEIIAELTGAVRLSSDEERRKMFPQPTFSEAEHQQLYAHLDKELEQLMKQHKNVIYDANLNRYQHRHDKYELAKRYSYEVKLIWLQTPQQLAKNRRVTDVAHYDLVPANEDPASMFERIVNLFEPPHSDEPYVKLDGTNVTTVTVRQLVQ